MKSSLYSLIKFVVGWPLSLVALFYIGKKILPGFQTVILRLHTINWTFFVLGMLAFLIYFFLRSYLWQKILHFHQYHLPYKLVTLLWAQSELKRYTPGNVWSFVGRAVLFEKRKIPKKQTATFLVYEAVFMLLGASIVSLMSLSFLWRYFIYDLYAPNSIFLFLAIVFLIFVGMYLHHVEILQKLRIKNLGLFRYFLTHLSSGQNGILLLVSTIAFFFFGLGYYLIATSIVYIHPQLVLELTGFFAFSYIVSYLSLITPSGIGVREGIITFGLGKILTVSIAGFVAVYTRVILILAELLFIVISFVWAHTKSKLLIRCEQFFINHAYETFLTIGILLYCCYFTTASFLRYDNFYTGRFDLGNMAQTVWNTQHGRFFELTNPNGTDTVSRLSVHADFFLIFLTPFYFIWSDPKMLLLIQTLLLSMGAIFVYLLAKDIVKNKPIALLFAVLYLLNPSVQRSNLYDFHAVTLAAPLLLGAFYYLRNKNYLPFAIFSLLAGTTKEQVWIIIGLLGGYIAQMQKKKVIGSILFFICVAFSYFLISYAIPQALGSNHFALSYYSDFGDKPFTVIKNIVLSPLKTLSTLLLPDRIEYFKQLFMPVGFLSFFAPLYLIFAVPDLLIYSLSSNAQLHQIYYQYTATITPFIFISAIYGFYFLTLRYPRIQKVVIICLVTSAALSLYLYSPLPGMREPNIDMLASSVTNKEEIDRFLNTIPKQYSVAASNNIGSHLSQRQNIYTIPLGVDRADVIVLMPDSTTPQMSVTQQQLVNRLRNDKNYTIYYEKEDFIAFKKIGL